MIEFSIEQKRAIELRDKDIIVSASAGSGKTTVMIQRVLSLLNQGAKLSDMVIVTFTKAAAADMKEKLAKSLQGIPSLTSSIKELSNADISTLHSFCQRLIGRYFYKVSIDPYFKIISGPEEYAFFNKALSEAIEDEIKNKDADFVEVSEIFGDRSGRALKKVVTGIYYGMVNRPSMALEPTDNQCKEILLQEIEGDKLRLCAAIEGYISESTAAGFTRNTVSAYQLMESLFTRGEVETARSRIPLEFKLLHERYRALVAESGKLIAKEDELLCAKESSLEYLSVLKRIAESSREKYAIFKKNRSLLDFSDLERYALEIINSDAGNEIRQKYKYIFVDEFQDINPLQNAIIEGLKSKDNHLFLVGDIKQSIYAFRGCEPSIFLKKREEFLQRDNCEVIDLNANHRSCPNILSFTDKIFLHAMGKDFGGTEYPPFICKSDATGGVFVYQKADDGSDTDESCEEEDANGKIYSVAEDKGYTDKDAENAAACIATLLEGKITEDGKGRAVQLKDIAVLTRSGGSTVTSLLEILKSYGIKAEASSKLVGESKPYIHALYSYLSLIDNANNDEALICALRSSFGGFSDEELYQIRKYSDSSFNTSLNHALKEYPFFMAIYDYIKGNSNSLSYKLKNFLDRLNYYRNLSGWLTVSELAGRIVTDFNYFHRVLLGGKAAAEALDSYLAFIEECCPNSLSEFLQMESEEQDTTFLSGDSVKVMTVHGSKGLEFPFVILLGVDKMFNRSDLTKPIIQNEGSFAIKHYDFLLRECLPSPHWLYNKKNLAKRIAEEELRLLYVALTRAKYQLHIFGMPSGKAGKGSDALRWSDWIAFAGNNFTLPPVAYAPKKQNRVFPKGDPVFNTKLTERFNFNMPIGNAPPKTYVTAVVNSQQDEDKGSIIYLAGEGDDRALEVGTAYHKAMEVIDFNQNFDDEWERLDLNTKNMVKKEEIRLAVSLMLKLAEGGKLYKEKSFMLSLPASEIGLIGGNVLVQGVIDLMIVSGGECIIVDYKTGSISDSYSRQLYYYALAANKILGLKVKDTLIYSFKTGCFISLK